LKEIKLAPETSRNNTSRIKIHLDNIPITNNSELLMDYTRENNDFFFSKKSLRHMKKETKNNNTTLSMTSPSTRAGHSKLETSDYAFSSCKMNHHEDLEEEKIIENAIKKKFNWNDQKETIFKNHRLDAKARLFNETKSSSFTEVAFSPLVQASQIDEKSKLQRDTKLAKYINGDPLSPEEYKFLANTSRSLNSHVDKNYLQTTINHLDSSVLESVLICL
jgi:hypothetical protein